MITEQQGGRTAGACNSSYVEWGPIFAGAVLACAISIVLLQFGSAVGLASTSTFTGEGLHVPGKVLAAGLWFLWVEITASIAGGYLAGRLRRPVTGIADHESEVRDGAHGLMVWATATVAVFLGVSAASAFAALVPPSAAGQAADAAQVSAIVKQNTAVVFAFVAGSVSLISGVAAWWAATKGGEHRDGSVDFSHHFSFRKRT